MSLIPPQQGKIEANLMPLPLFTTKIFKDEMKSEKCSVRFQMLFLVNIICLVVFAIYVRDELTDLSFWPVEFTASILHIPWMTIQADVWESSVYIRYTKWSAYGNIEAF